ncbi:MAG TPA: EF-hand domain-containing protein [Burkholderiales bacterium]|nr:EF-hand domain-containing protein [Burkholderiales bacterium]
MTTRNAGSRYLSRVLIACPLLVSAALLANMAPLTAAPHYQPAEVQPIWMKIDLDGDGTISRDELREEDPRLLLHFDQADLDHDGTLSLRELELLLLSV